MRSVLSAALALLGLLVACGGDAKVGESCDEVGNINDECEEGGVCGIDGDGSKKCLKICYAVTDCPSGRACGDVPNTSTKGCRSTQ